MPRKGDFRMSRSTIPARISMETPQVSPVSQLIQTMKQDIKQDVKIEIRAELLKEFKVLISEEIGRLFLEAMNRPEHVQIVGSADQSTETIHNKWNKLKGQDERQNRNFVPRSVSKKASYFTKNLWKILGTLCQKCNIGTPVVIESEDTKGRQFSVRVRQFTNDLEQHGEDYVKTHWKFICRGCTQARTREDDWWLGMRKARKVVSGFYRYKCERCKTEAGKSLLLMGPGKNPVDTYKLFMKTLSTEGQNSVLQKFELVCRTCLQGVGGINRWEPKPAA